MSFPALSARSNGMSPRSNVSNLSSKPGGKRTAAKLKAQLWKERERVRQRAQIRLQKDCGCTKKQADAIASELLRMDKKFVRQWQACEPPSEVLVALTKKIQKRWATEAARKNVMKSATPESRGVVDTTDIDAELLRQVNQSRNEKSNRLKNNPKDIWTNLIEFQLKEAAEKVRGKINAQCV